MAAASLVGSGVTSAGCGFSVDAPAAAVLAVEASLAVLLLATRSRCLWGFTALCMPPRQLVKAICVTGANPSNDKYFSSR